MLTRLKPSNWTAAQAQGVSAALLSAVVLGLAPIFGKQAILAGTHPLAVVALRTALGVAAMWLLFGLFWRRYLFIYPAGLYGCLTAGFINGVGSLMYYSGLGRLDASLAHLLYTLYPVFLTLFARLDGHTVSPFTLLRTLLALGSVYLLTRTGHSEPDWVGAGLMLGAGLLYAFHLAVNQRVLYDMPPQTVTVYTLTAMGLTVAGGFGLTTLVAGLPAMPPTAVAWEAVLLLTLVTVVSRLTLFMGVKRLGSMQTALIGLSELLVTVLLARALLGEVLSPTQWLGAGLLAASVLMVVREKGLGDVPAPRPWLPLISARFAPVQRHRLPPARLSPAENPPANIPVPHDKGRVG
jgi:drug/metabolite transporter (DMT)-like permease